MDHPTEPTAVLIWNLGQEGFQMVGDTQSKLFLSELEEYISNDLGSRLLLRTTPQ